MKGARGWLLLLALCVVFVCLFSGCQPKREEAPLAVSFYGNLDESYGPFLTALEEQFPEANLQYEYQWDTSGSFEMQRRILHGDGPDLAVVNGAALDSMSEQNLLLDLTAQEFSTRYHISSMMTMNDAGRICGLPLPNDLKCLLCNRTVLQKYGISELPKTLKELLEICERLTVQGQKALMTDAALYDMLLDTSFLSKPEGYDWLQNYNDGKGTMAGTPAAEAWAELEHLAAVSGCCQNDALAMPARRTTWLLEGSYAFRASTISNLKYIMESAPESEIIALPLLGETEADQWVFYSGPSAMRYFVANGQLSKPEHTAKKELVLKMLDWISTAEAQQLLADCSGAAVSYVNHVELEQGEIMQYLAPVISSGHLTVRPDLERGVKAVATNCVAQIACGEMTALEAVAACDKQNATYIPPQEPDDLNEVIGIAKEPVYWRKPAAVTIGAPMAQLAAQAMKETFLEADFAFAMAKSVGTSLYAGEITLQDIKACANGENGDRQLVLVEATGDKISELIDAGVGTAVSPTHITPYGIAGAGRLLHPAGLTYQADVTKEKGEKVTEIHLDNGNLLEPDKYYTIVVPDLLVDFVTEPNLKDCQVMFTGTYQSDALEAYIRAHKEIQPPEQGFHIKGALSGYTLPGYAAEEAGESE